MPLDYSRQTATWPFARVRARNLLSAAVVLALASSFAAHAQTADASAPSQTAEAATLDAVKVTGTRASIQKSQAVKQDAPNFVDAISAEDVGKFPDPNVAEALQRVTGIAIGRDNSGEGKKLSIRGLGPDFVSTQLNGRRLASEDGSRSFNYDVLPSEIISTVEVNKSALASLSEGGSGGTVNILTARPLDKPGTHFAASVSGVYDKLAGKTAPRASATFSTTNEDKTLGFSVGVSRYERDSAEEYFQGGWKVLNRDGVNPGTGVYDGLVELGAKASPWGVGWGAATHTRERTGLNLALDWKLADNVTLRLDGLWTRWDQDVVNQSLNVEPYTQLDQRTGAITEADSDANGTITRLLMPNGGGTVNSYLYTDPRRARTRGFGANLEWVLSEATTARFDIWKSKAENDVAGGSLQILLTTPVPAGTRVEWFNPGELGPGYFTGLPTMTDPTAIGAGWSTNRGGGAEESITEAKADFSTSFTDGALAKLEYGVYASDATKVNSYAESPWQIACAYCGVPNTLPASFFTGVRNISGLLDGKYPNVPTQFITYDYKRYHDILLNDPSMLQQLMAGLPDWNRDTVQAALQNPSFNGYEVRENIGSRSTVHEATKAAYLQATFMGDWGSVPWSAVVGVRGVKTEVNAQGYFNTIEGFRTVTVQGKTYEEFILSQTPQAVSRQAGYTEWLPSLNTRFNLRDNLVARFAAYRTMTRPQLDNLRVNDSYGQSEGTFSVWRGNPGLKPFLADNLDLSLEWYITDQSMVSLSAFWKKVDGFAVTQARSTEIDGRTFRESTQVNADSAEIRGLEGSLTYILDFLPSPFDGLGVQLNYTKVDSNRMYDPSKGTDQFTIPGLSDTGNAILFYDKGRFSIRAAYNWRDTYQESITSWAGVTYVEPFSSLDMSASFAFNDHFGLFAEATNLTDEQSIRWSDYKNRVTFIYRGGTTFTFGIRGKW